MLPSPSTTPIVHSREPYNAEPPLDRLRASFLTPVEQFYVRCHGPVPAIDPEHYRLTVAGCVAEPLTLSLDELASRFETVSITATMQCAGNRRADLAAVSPVTGDPWAAGAIGTAVWTGYRLIDLLIEAGIDEETALHVAFEGFDDVETPDGTARFGASIPVEKATAGDVLLAVRMNDEPLTPHHGAPLRLVVPGYAGVRSVKWLSAVEVRETPSQNFHQQKDYRLFPAGITTESMGAAAGMTINEMPLNSAICEPRAGTTIPAGPTRIRGYAIAGERRVTRVDVSIDDGRTWVCAAIEEHSGSAFTWTFWHADVDLSAGEHTLLVRAVDSAGQTQPRRAEDVWNCKGYLSAAWHRVEVTVSG